jgi:hypothetical protein
MVVSVSSLAKAVMDLNAKIAPTAAAKIYPFILLTSDIYCPLRKKTITSLNCPDIF